MNLRPAPVHRPSVTIRPPRTVLHQILTLNRTVTNGIAVPVCVAGLFACFAAGRITTATTVAAYRVVATKLVQLGQIGVRRSSITVQSRQCGRPADNRRDGSCSTFGTTSQSCSLISHATSRTVPTICRAMRGNSQTSEDGSSPSSPDRDGRSMEELGQRGRRGA